MTYEQLTRIEQKRPIITVAIILALSLMLGACSGAQPAAQPAEPIASAWAGKVEGTDAFIALASNGKELMAYVCDSQTITQWFHGQVGVDQLDLVAGTVDLSANGAKLQAQLTLETASGTLTLADGQSYSFDAPKATGDAGLYRAEETVNNEKSVTGWVVLNDGQLRGLTVNLHTGSLQPQTSLNNLAQILGPHIPQY